MNDMLKRSLLILPALLITFTLNAQQVMVDKIVAVVGNSAIYYSDVVESANMLVNQRREMGYTSDRDPQNEALEQLMMQKLLYHQAQIDSVDVNTADIAITVEDYLQNMISEAGSIAALEEREHKAVFDILQPDDVFVFERNHDLLRVVPVAGVALRLRVVPDAHARLFHEGGQLEFLRHHLAHHRFEEVGLHAELPALGGGQGE